MGTPSVELRRLTPPDVPALTAITVTEGDRIVRYFGRDDPAPPELRRALLTLARAAAAPPDGLPWHGVVLVADQPVGLVVLGTATARRPRSGFWLDVVDDEDATTSVDVTVWIAQEWCGQGVGRSAVRQALDHAAAAFGSRRALAAIQPGNTSSLALFRALGFQQVRVGGTWLVFALALHD